MLVDRDELARFDDLRLRLKVNGQLRQDSTVKADMIYKPVQALAALTRFQALSAGDLILTGTPGRYSTVRTPPKRCRSSPPCCLTN